MKRYLLTIVCLLMGFALRSQSVYTCQYWFDEDDGQAVTTTFGGDIWQAAIDVGSLPDGVHTLHFHALISGKVLHTLHKSEPNLSQGFAYPAMDSPESGQGFATPAEVCRRSGLHGHRSRDSSS